MMLPLLGGVTTGGPSCIVLPGGGFASIDMKSPASLCFIELDPKYVSVIVQCWRDQTGQAPS